MAKKLCNEKSKIIIFFMMATVYLFFYLCLSPTAFSWTQPPNGCGDYIYPGSHVNLTSDTIMFLRRYLGRDHWISRLVLENLDQFCLGQYWVDNQGMADPRCPFIVKDFAISIGKYSSENNDDVSFYHLYDTEGREWNAINRADYWYEKAKIAYRMHGKNMFIDEDGYAVTYATYLGRALHYIQDMTCPAHNEGWLLHVLLEEYEGLHSKNVTPDPPFMPWIDGVSGSDFAEYAHNLIIPYVQEFKNLRTIYTHFIAEEYLKTLTSMFLKFAIEVGAGMIIRFHQQVEEREFYYISGILTDVDGNFAQGYIYAWETAGTNPGNYVWTSDGSYSMALFPGTYNIYAMVYKYYPNGYLFFGTETQKIIIKEDTSLNIQAPPHHFYHITGRVTDIKGNGIAYAKINFWGPSNSFTWTSSDGSYDALVVEGSNYTLEVIPPSGSRFVKEFIYDLQIYGNIEKNISLMEQFVLSGNVINIYGQSTQDWTYIYAYEINGANPGNYGWGNPDGTYQLSLLPGTYVVGGTVYFINPNGGYTWVSLPQQTINLNSDRSLSIVFPLYNFSHLRGKVTNINNVGISNVKIEMRNILENCGSIGYTTIDGSFDLLLNQGTYTMRVSAPPATYPPFDVKKIDIKGDTIRNIRLSREYIILQQAISQLLHGLDLGLDVYDIISQGTSITYDLVVRSTKNLLQIILNWPGSQMGMAVYQPDGSIYGQYQSNTPPIIIEIPNPDLGTWKFEVIAIDVPYDNYPFALVVGVTPNQSPTAEAGGPYLGIVGSPISFDASSSYDPDGEIVLYEWDWNNDGIYDESTSSPTITHTWLAAFTGIVKLRVTDNEGSTGIDTASVEIRVITGDLDGDGDVDQNDLNILLKYRNQPASACPACDLDGDGMITVLDARKLVLLCTRPKCATQ